MESRQRKGIRRLEHLFMSHSRVGMNLKCVKGFMIAKRRDVRFQWDYIDWYYAVANAECHELINSAQKLVNNQQCSKLGSSLKEID